MPPPTQYLPVYLPPTPYLPSSVLRRGACRRPALGGGASVLRSLGDDEDPAERQQHATLPLRIGIPQAGPELVDELLTQPGRQGLDCGTGAGREIGRAHV